MMECGPEHMTDRVTIWRFFHPANIALLADGRNVEVIGWTAEEAVDGMDLDQLAEEANQVGRVAYVYHSEAKDPESLVASFREALGFTPEFSECETLLREEIVSKGAREDWFDVFDGTCAPDENIYLLYPATEENLAALRRRSVETLFV